jgi:peptidoglycan/LPS O-acetylase OafA/YrhL
VPRYLEYILPLLLVYIFYCRWHMTAVTREMFALAILPAFFGTFVFIYALSDGLYVRRLSTGFFQFLGKISYSVYLNHAIVLILVTRLFFDVLKVPKNEWTILVSVLFSLVAVILYSKFTFENVELKNMYRYSRKKPALIPEANSAMGTEGTEP